MKRMVRTGVWAVVMAAVAVVTAGIFCGTAFAQEKPKAAVYIMGNPEGRDALRMAVNTFLVKSGKYQMVAVDAIDVVAKEQKRQMSGSVSDAQIAKLGQDAGAQYVCVVERTMFDGYSYVATRMISVQSKVAEFADMVKLPQGGDIIEIIQWQVGSMLGMEVGPRPTFTQSTPPPPSPQSANAAEQQSTPSQSSATDKAASTANKATIAQRLAWLKTNAESHKQYTIDVYADENISPYTFEFNGVINVAVVFRGVGGNRTIRLKSNGTMFTVKSNVTLILDSNITLHGHSGNTDCMVYVNGGILKIRAGATITGNLNTVTKFGSTNGGGIMLRDGTVDMTGGIISNNESSFQGGGVYISGGTFRMSGGAIVGNNATKKGGGVYLAPGNVSFIMSGGTISTNSSEQGGGIYVAIGTIYYTPIVKITGGTITNNTASEKGGGVYCDSRQFSKTGGTITGYDSDPSNGNVVKAGSVLTRRGHAISIVGCGRREDTVGPRDVLNAQGVCSGNWDK